MSATIPMIGQKFGRLTVTRQIPKPDGSQAGQHRYEAVCDCGKVKSFWGYHLRKGATVSCGCFRKERARIATSTHSMSGTSEYGIWCGIIERCCNPNATMFPYYGGRGIKICDTWRNSFEEFFKYMGARPSSALSIDRIDNDGDYCPGNVRWATKIEQMRNRSNTTRCTIGGVTRPAQEWAEIMGISVNFIRGAISKGSLQVYPA